MPVDPVLVVLLTAIATVLVQAIKGLLAEPAKKFIPLVLLVLMSAIGAGVALYQGGDVLAGVIAGFFAGAGAVGIYETGSSLPGLDRVFNSAGWIKRGA